MRDTAPFHFFVAAFKSEALIIDDIFVGTKLLEEQLKGLLYSGPRIRCTDVAKISPPPTWIHLN